MKLLKIGLMLLVIMGVGASPAQALVRMEDKGTVTVGEAEVIDDDLYIAGENVEIEGTVNGDVYAAGGMVNVSGSISGDLVIGAGDVRVSGDVGDDLWIGGGSVNLIGAVVGDGVNIGAGQVIIDQDSTIGGSLLAGAGSLNVSAPIARNLMVGAGQVRLDAPVGGEMRVGAESIELGDDASIAGDLTYMSEGELMMAEAATVAGETRMVEGKYPRRNEREEWKTRAAGAAGAAHVGMNIFSFFGALVVGLVLVWLKRKPMLEIAEVIKGNLLGSLGWGVLSVVLAFPIFVMLMVTGIGIPLALIYLALVMIEFYLAKIFASFALGQVLQKKFEWKKMHDGWVMVVGLTVYYVLRMIPVIGMFVRMLAFLAGVGGVMLKLKSVKN